MSTSEKTEQNSLTLHLLRNSSEEKVLGVFWDTQYETLGFKEIPDVKFTKMELDSTVTLSLRPFRYCFSYHCEGEDPSLVLRTERSAMYGRNR